MLYFMLLLLENLQRSAIYVEIDNFGKILEFGHFTQRVAIKLD